MTFLSRASTTLTSTSFGTCCVGHHRFYCPTSSIGITFEQSVALGKELGVKPPAPATLEKHRRFLVTFFSKLVKAKAIPMSPMDAFPEIKKDLVVDTNKPERLFDEEELQRIFAPKTFTAWAKKYPHRWWLPMISLYTGARINELAQLKVADIVEEAKVWCIRIKKRSTPISGIRIETGAVKA